MFCKKSCFQNLIKFTAKNLCLWSATLLKKRLRALGHACRITKKGQESTVKGHNCEFFPLIFLNSGHLECYTPHKRHVVLEFLVFRLAKSALHGGTAHNKWLKWALTLLQVFEFWEAFKDIFFNRTTTSSACFWYQNLLLSI